jgi:RNA polymerase sigma-70 factor (ECF subfamily)
MTDLATPTRVALERELEAHRRDLTGYCYRMLGSAFEAEDAVQETMVRAWRALDRFEGRAALRSWLFGIATNVCIDALNAGRRRALPMDLGPASAGDAPLGPVLPTERWVGPAPDARTLPVDGDPAEVASAREGIRLAFVAALQHLNPRQRAVLILRDVLRWKAEEVAQLLDSSTTSVHSTLRRARAALAEVVPAGRPDLTADAYTLVDRYVDAFTRYDVDAIVALLHEDVVLSMPPYPLWIRGIDGYLAFLAAGGRDCRGTRFVPVAANGSIGLAAYRPTGPGGAFEPFAIQVVEVSCGRIVGIHAFLEPALFPLFGAPLRLG